MEFDLSTPLTSPVWQSLNAFLISSDSLDVGGWDLRHGILDYPIWRECAVHFPASERALIHSNKRSKAIITFYN